MAVAKRWQQFRTALIVAECGTGKTLMSLGAVHVHSQGKLYTGLAMVPPHLVEKWAREALRTAPGIRVFLIDDMRNGGDEKAPHGVNEVRLKRGMIVREGLRTTLSDLRLRKKYRSPRELVRLVQSAGIIHCRSRKGEIGLLLAARLCRCALWAECRMPGQPGR